MVTWPIYFRTCNNFFVLYLLFVFSCVVLVLFYFVFTLIVIALN